MSDIYQDRKTGKRVRRVGSATDTDGTVMVIGNDNNAYYAALANLMPCDEAGTPDFDWSGGETPEEKEAVMPVPRVPIAETRVNLNVATAEEIHTRVPGISYSTAKRIKERQTTLQGERFSDLEQIKSANSRLNWDAIFRLNQLYIG